MTQPNMNGGVPSPQSPEQNPVVEYLAASVRAAGQMLTFAALYPHLQPAIDPELVREIQQNTLNSISQLGGDIDTLFGADGTAPESEVNSPVDASGTETKTIVDEVIESEALKDLPEGFRREAITEYFGMDRVIRSRIDEGVLPEDYRMPPLETFSLAKLAPKYEAMEKNDWKPQLVFVPLELDFDQSTALFTGQWKMQGTEKDLTTNGISRMQETIPTKAASNDEPRWAIAVINGTESPILTSVSPDGRNWSGAGNILSLLRDLYDRPQNVPPEDVTPQRLIKSFTPPQAVYFAMQLARLAGGVPPVDQRTSTFSIDTVQIGNDSNSANLVRTMYFSKDKIVYGRVESSVSRSDLGLRPYIGIRNKASKPSAQK